MLNDINDEFTNFNSIDVYVVGGAPEIDDSDNRGLEDYLEKKRFIKKSLENFGFKKDRTKINYQDSGQGTNIKIDTKTGKILIETLNESF